MKKERFKKPTDEELCDFALLVQTDAGESPVNHEILVNMVAFGEMLVERLYEHGTIKKKSTREKEADAKNH